MIEGAFVFPEVSVGIIDASAIRNRNAMHAQALIDHRHIVLTHFTGAHRMISGLSRGLHPFNDLGIGLARVTWRQFLTLEAAPLQALS